MKKKVTVLFAGLLVVGFCAVSYTTGHYTRRGVVIETQNNNAIIKDSTGGTWYVEDCTGLEIGDNVKMKLWDCLTDDVMDDEIKKIEKIIK